MKKAYVGLITELKKRKILYISLILVVILSFATFVPVYFKTGLISYAPDSIIVKNGVALTVEEATESKVNEDVDSDSASNVSTNQNKPSKTVQTPSTTATPNSTSSNISPSNSTPESPSAFVSFYADTQSDTDGDDQNHRNVVSNILNSGSNPVFHAGDLMEDGTEASLNRFNSVTANLRSTRTFYSALGNNDRKVGDSTLPSPLYFSNFSYPNNEQWYSVNIGNLHMVVLDSAFSANSSSQLSWLQADLQAVPSSKIVGVMYHHPTFSSTVHNILRDNRVDFVVTGHYHSYSQATSDGIHYYVLSGQPSIGYLTAKIYSYSVAIAVYNSSNSIVDSATFANR